MTQKCEICDRQTDFFEDVDYGDKCIFHYDKSDEERWGNPDSADVDRFSRAIKEQIQYDIDNDIDRHRFEKYIFPIFIWGNKTNNFLLESPLALMFSTVSFMYEVEIRDIYIEKCHFDGSIFYKDVKLFSVDIESLHFSACKFLGNFNVYMIGGNEFVVEFITLEKSVLFVDSVLEYFLFDTNRISKDTYIQFENLECKELNINGIVGDLTSFNIKNVTAKNAFEIGNCNLLKTTFNGLHINEASLIGIKESSFMGSHLTQIDWGQIDENRFVDNLHFKNKVDRQIIRQLKSIYDTQGETVIANDFYALEMRLRSKELNWREHFGEKLVQNIHGLVSNYSNDWALPTIWFFVLGLLFGVLARDIIPTPITLSIFGLIGVSIAFADRIPTKYYKMLAFGFLAMAALLYSLSYVSVEYVAALMNPLNIKDSKDLLGDTNLVLIYACRTIEVFIGYQIITAIRKNTRRK